MKVELKIGDVNAPEVAAIAIVFTARRREGSPRGDWQSNSAVDRCGRRVSAGRPTSDG